MRPPGSAAEARGDAHENPARSPIDAKQLGESELMLGVRAGEWAHVQEYVRRYRALLMREARLMRVPDADREIAVLETLHDTAIAFIEGARPLPRSPAAYLLTALRRRVYNERRDRARREGREVNASRDSEADTGQGDVVLALCSEAMVAASRGEAADQPAVSPAVRRLVALVIGDLTDAERLWLGWDAARVPYRQIAEWLGIEYKAACKRMERLRARLKSSALAHAASMRVGDREALDRILRRADIRRDSSGSEGRDHE
jgi:DNA-directed RNA polymerase specialized sigma24 family protein